MFYKPVGLQKYSQASQYQPPASRDLQKRNRDAGGDVHLTSENGRNVVAGGSTRYVSTVSTPKLDAIPGLAPQIRSSLRVPTFPGFSGLASQDELHYDIVLFPLSLDPESGKYAAPRAEGAPAQALDLMGSGWCHVMWFHSYDAVT